MKHSFSEFTNKYYNIAYKSEVTMNIFKRLKEIVTNRKILAEQEKQLSQLELKQKELTDSISKKTKQLEKKDELIQIIKDLVNEENSSERDSIIAKAKEESQELISKAKSESESLKESTNTELSEILNSVNKYTLENTQLTNEHIKLQKEVKRYINQARKYKVQVTGLKNFNERFPYTIDYAGVNSIVEDLNNELGEETVLGTIIRLQLHSDNSKELRKLSNATKKEITKLLTDYEKRYTTKANRTIYNLMIIGLQAEMQTLLFKLTYEKLDETKKNVKDIMTKYLTISAEGNKSILPTITKFISEIEPLYLELVDIEYRYYVYRQKEKEEQQAIKEQMKQEIEERKVLEYERKKLNQEESKFITEMQRNKQLLESEVDDIKIVQLKTRLAELEDQLLSIEDKKEEIASLALGKAGYVYIISNLGSFGNNTFKIGMTRRMVPQQRIDELGSASVPFRFDVHALIFSNDAVGLEGELHKRLSDKRINKINYRKEFFRTNIENLEQLVENIDPTAEFNKTMYAEEYSQTMALEENLKHL